MPAARHILHVDMDAFFASVEQALDPSLRGKPVIVGGPTDRSVVSAASYEARKHGVHSAMPIARARRLCPAGIFLPGNFQAYRRYSHRVRDLLHHFTPVIEQLSLDDFYLDLTGCTRLHGHPFHIADTIRHIVLKKTGLPVSIGVAAGKLVAKIASARAKPNGILLVKPGHEAAFLRHLPLEKLPGIGPAAARQLRKFNLHTLGHVAAIPAPMLQRVFGPWGATLRLRAQGIDHSPVIAEQTAPKSISREHTFTRDTLDHNHIRATLCTLTARAARQLREENLLARTLTLKLRYADFKTATAAAGLHDPTDMDHHLYAAALDRLEYLLLRKLRIRLVGVCLSNLIPRADRQATIFDRPARQRQHRLYAGLDHIRLRHGFHILSSAAALKRIDE